MSLKKFPTTTMIALSDPMADPEKDRGVLEAYPPSAGIVRFLVDAHNGLLRIHVPPDEVTQKLKVLSDRALALDGRHDDAYRRFHGALTVLASIASEERRQLLEGIRDTLMPEGLLGVRDSYLSEAGRVEVATSRMTPEIEKVLRETVVEDKSLFQLFTDWVAAGRELGDVERERVRLSEKDSADTITLSDVQKARFYWIRAMNALVDVLALDPALPEELQNRILQPLRHAEAKQARKKSKGGAAEEEATTDSTPDNLSETA